MIDSCFAAKLGVFVRLSDAEKRALARLEENPRPFGRGDRIRTQGDAAEELYIVRSGWLYSHFGIEGGKRQILRFAFPGDLLGTSSAAFGTATDSITAVTDGEICPMERGALAELFAEHGRLAALLFAISQAERVSLNDRLASVGRTTAHARVASLLLDLLVRYRLMNGKAVDSIELPLTQEEIGDATGLTSVHVNRMLRQLSDEGLIERDGSRVRIPDSDRLAAAAGYTDRFAHIDLGWLPPADA